MRLRKQTRRAAIVPLQPGAALDPIADTDMNTTPERSAEREQVRRLLEAEIDSLPDDYRAVFMLRAVEELSVEETADVLGIPHTKRRSASPASAAIASWPTCSRGSRDGRA